MAARPKQQARVAVVTGAASGIGASVAAHLTKGGWQVFGLDSAFPRATASPKRGMRRVHCDVASSASVAEAFRAVAAEAASIDALVSSAGILRVGAVATMSEGDFDATFSVNTRGGWLCAKAALPLLSAGSSRPAAPRIVFVSSASAIRPKVGSGVYAASKAALSTLVRVLAVELAEQGIRVNAVAPGTVDTPFIGKAGKGDGSFRPSGNSPLGRIATPDDVAAVVDFLLSPGSDYLTGAVIPVDGGDTAAYRPRQAAQSERSK